MQSKQSMPVFLDITKFADFRWKIAYISRNLGGCNVIHLFLDLFQVRFNCAKFHYCRICVNDFREEEAFWPPILEQPIMNRVKNVFGKYDRFCRKLPIWSHLLKKLCTLIMWINKATQTPLPEFQDHSLLKMLGGIQG